MKRIIVTGLLILICGVGAYAQPGGKFANREEARERIRAVKVAYITDKLRLTSDQAAKFWPVYNQYEKEVMKTRKKFMEKYSKENPDKDEDAARHYIEDNLDYQQDILDLRKKYNDDFLRVLSAQQVADLYRAEREFKQLLIQQLHKRREEREQGSRHGDNDNFMDGMFPPNK